MAATAAPCHLERIGIAVDMEAADADVGVALLTQTTIQIIGVDRLPYRVDRWRSVRVFPTPFVCGLDRLRAIMRKGATLLLPCQATRIGRATAFSRALPRLA
jgi:hypothetical protein